MITSLERERLRIPRDKENDYTRQEICAAVVLARETSLAAAMLHGDWLSAHENLGRNRP